MPSEVATLQSAAPQSASPTAATTANLSSSDHGVSETSTSSPTSVSEGFSPERSQSAGSGSDGGESELRSENFDSLQAFAQALLDKRQPTKPEDPQSADASSDDQQIEEDVQAGSMQAPEDQAEDQTREQPEEQPAEATLDLEAGDVFSPKDLNERINANPALRQALETDPALRNAVFRNARLASETGKYKEVFPDVESAQYAAQEAARFREVDELFLNATTPRVPLASCKSGQRWRWLPTTMEIPFWNTGFRGCIRHLHLCWTTCATTNWNFCGRPQRETVIRN